MYDIAIAGFCIGIAKYATIAIKLLHHGEVGVADAHYDYRAGEEGELLDNILRLFHIMDGTVCQYQQNLVLWLTLLAPYHLVELLQKRRKESWAHQPDLRQSLDVSICHTFYRVNCRVLRIADDWEAVRSLLHAHGPVHATETKHWETSVGVIGLTDSAH